MGEKGQNLFISWVLFFPLFFLFSIKQNLISSTGDCNQSWMCDFGSLARWWFVLQLFTEDFIRLGEYSLMKHLVLCKFLLMAGKNVSRAWYSLDSEKAGSSFLVKITVYSGWEELFLSSSLLCCFETVPLGTCFPLPGDLCNSSLCWELRCTLSYLCPKDK